MTRAPGRHSPADSSPRLLTRRTAQHQYHRPPVRTVISWLAQQGPTCEMAMSPSIQVEKGAFEAGALSLNCITRRNPAYSSCPSPETRQFLPSRELITTKTSGRDGLRKLESHEISRSCHLRKLEGHETSGIHGLRKLEGLDPRQKLPHRKLVSHRESIPGPFRELRRRGEATCQAKFSGGIPRTSVRS